MSSNTGNSTASQDPLATKAWRVVDGSALSAHGGHREPIKGVITGDLGMLFGDSNAGKTLVAIDMAIHLMSGQPWAGRRTDRMPVIYVATEAAVSTERRFIAIQKARGVAIPAAMFQLVDAPVSLRSSIDVDRMIDLARQMGSCGVLFCDTLANMSDGADENSVGEMAPILASAARFIRATGWAVVLLHHTNKSGGYRGSSSIRARQDFAIEVIAPRANEIEVRAEKLRDATKGPICSMRISGVEVGVDGYGDPLVAPVATVVSTSVAATVASGAPTKGHIRTSLLREIAVQAFGESGGAPLSEKNLRTRFNESLGEGLKGDGQRKAFDRARSDLVQSNEIRVEHGMWHAGTTSPGQADRTAETGQVQPVHMATNSGQTGQDGAPLGARPCPDVPEPDDEFDLRRFSLRGVKPYRELTH